MSAGPTPPGAPRAPWRRPRVIGLALAVLFAALAAVAIGESMGWPFLAAPLERALSRTLERRVQIGAVAQPAASSGGASAGDAKRVDGAEGTKRADGADGAKFADGAEGADASPASFRVRFFGGVALQAAHLEIGAPAWSKAPHLLRAADVALALRYVDLWRAWRGQPLRIQRLQASRLDAQLERLADGSASWSFRAPAAIPGPAPAMPSFGSLQVDAGSLHLRDALLALDITAQLTLADAAGPAPAAEATATASAAAPASAAPPSPRRGSLLQAQASGRVRGMPLQAELTASGAMPWAADGENTTPVPMRLKASVGRARFAFDGTALDALRLQGLSGRFSLSGPSLAAVGDPLGVTLPTTAPFSSAGIVVQQGAAWRVQVDSATIGGSRLDGRFSYERSGGVPLLAGRLGGRRLLLADLGPVVGTTPIVEPAATAKGKPSHGPGKVLPDRPFDLAALRAMNANVLIDIAEVDLNTSYLEPLRPLRGHLVLAGGVLTLRDLDARTAQGELRGTLRLDGQGTQALWRADLRWNGVQLERWLHQARAAGQPPWVTGRLDGSATLAGQGRSTAEILATLKGKARSELRGGTVSHLAVEAAGVDLAQALGVMVKGDDALPVHCAVADLVAEGGVFRPRVLVLDTSDSSVWVEGSISLAAETLDLRAVVSPKDFSPLALRTPLRVRGTFAQPEVSLEKGPMGRKLGAAFLLALVNPLAALIPFIDPGSADNAQRSVAGCQALSQRRAVRPAAAVR